MPDNKNSRLIENEVAFFLKIYGEERYNPVGWRLRLEREKRNLLRLAGSKKLGRILSLGCGNGQFELLLAPYAEKIIGLDISPKAVETANQLARASGIANVDFRIQAIENIEEQEKFDAILCLAFLHHIQPAGLAPLLNSICSHLSPGGIFYSQDPSINGFLRKLGHRFFQSWTSRFHSPDEYELDPSALAAQARAAGFSRLIVGYNDLTLIPGMYVFKRGFSLLMHLMAWVDWVWCHSPLARWASCFYLFAEK